MVARQMRENQERKDGPNYKWTEKERNLYELQQKSRSKLKVLLILQWQYCKISFYFQSDLVLDILEKNKPPPPGPPKYYNLPLLLSLLLLLLGLFLVSLSLYDQSKTSIAVKCLGSGLVFAGTSAVLMRILYSSSPTSLHFNSVTTNNNTQYKCGKNM